ncbi:MAG: aminotransferase class V-fold PLP-dependent enzyme, partial [Nanoarchaeota archaeon]
MNQINFFGKDRYFQAYSEDIMDIVRKVYSHGKVVMGPEVEEFEKKVAGFCSRKYGIAVGSCTDALHLSLIAAGVKKDDEVLVTGLSFIASTTCIVRLGAVPVFVDVNPETYMMDLEDLENKITPKTKAIVAVDLFGDALNIEAVETIGKRHNIPIIEDAAQSIGSRYDERKVGSMGLCSCISFDPTKILAAQSNGGAVLTDDEDVYRKISKMRYHGKNMKTGEFEMLG